MTLAGRLTFRFTSALVASVLLCGVAISTANADHNAPVEASKTSVSFVTSYLPCAGGSLSDPASGAGNACPAQRRSANFSFAGKGNLSGYLLVTDPGKPVNPKRFIAPGTVGPDARVFFRGKGVLKNGLPYNGDLFLSNRPRFTDDGCAVSCTLTDVDGVYPRPAGLPPVCKGGRCLEIFSSNNNLGSLLPGPEPPVKAGLRSNAEERGVCITSALPFPNAMQDVIACHGFVVGKPTSALPSSFDYPRPGSASKTDNVMVRAYDQAVQNGPNCEAQTHVAPLNVPGLVSACTAVPSSNRLDFGPNGRGSFKMRALNSPSNPRLLADIRATDVRDANSGQPFSGLLSYRVQVRVTHAACDGGAVCTLPDKTLSIPVDCNQGECRGRGDLGANLPRNTISLVEHTPAPSTAATSPDRPCLYDDAPGRPAKPFTCVGVYVP